VPYEISTFQLPCGARAARVRLTGILDVHEARSMLENWAPGRPMYGTPSLVVPDETHVMMPEARSFFGSWKEASATEWFAVVVSNPIARVTGNFIQRVSKATHRKMFPTEAEAVRWLDERARQNAAPAG
jgi:hypothetical protein